MPVVGIDIGTQSLKAVIADETFTVLGEACVQYRPAFPQPGWAEQHPDLWTDAIGPAVARALEASGRRREDIKGVAVVGQVDGCIPVDVHGKALSPCIIWPDRRASGCIKDISAELIRDRAGLALDATHMAAKIRWAARKLETASQVATWHQPVSYIVAALTGAHVFDHGIASTTMLYNLRSREYDDSLLEAFDIDRRKLPTIAAASAIAGCVTAAGSALIGLPIGTPVAVGTGDDFSNPLGAGLVHPGTVSVTVGTAEVVGTLSDELTIDPELLVETHGYFGDRYFLSNPGWLSGGAVSWFLETFSVDNASSMSALANAAPAGCDGLLFLPALSGAMAPRWVADARGAFYGLTPSHGKAHCARAVFEGAAFAMLDVIDRLSDLAPASRLRLMGGGARSAVWARIRADLAGLPVDVCTYADTSTLGAAILASVAAGVHVDVEAAVESMSVPLVAIEPDPRARDCYRDAHARYRALFEALASMHGG